jgi:hypothetical protein
MKKLSLSLILVIIVSAVTAQKVINDPNAEKRNVSGYHAISVSGGIDLYLSQGGESVAVSASETKYRDRIKTEVKDGVLKIWYETNSNINIEWGNNRKMKAYVSFKDIDKLTGSGGSDIDVEGAIKVTKLSLDISGGSDFDGKVEANDLKVEASGGSDVDISGSVKNLTIDASGGSDVEVTINKELSANASGGSDVSYKGNGTVRDMKSSGSSSIKKTSR